MVEKTTKKDKDKKSRFELHPEIPDAQMAAVKMEEVELDETLSILGRMKAARKMRRLANSGILKRGKKRKDLLAMTRKRASKLGWKDARRQIKSRFAGGKDFSTLSAGAKTRIEKIADKKKALRMALARKLTLQKMTAESVVDEAFNLMLEGKRYHQLFNKDGGVKFDMRFKHFQAKSNPHFEVETEEEVIDTVSEMMEVVEMFSYEERNALHEAAALKALHLMQEQIDDLNLNLGRVSRQFKIDRHSLLEAYNATDV